MSFYLKSAQEMRERQRVMAVAVATECIVGVINTMETQHLPMVEWPRELRSLSNGIVDEAISKFPGVTIGRAYGHRFLRVADEERFQQGLLDTADRYINAEYFERTIIIENEVEVNVHDLDARRCIEHLLNSLGYNVYLNAKGTLIVKISKGK